MILKTEKHNLAVRVALIIILGFVVYGNSLKGAFIWDDFGLIRDNAYIRSWSNLAEVFSKDMCLGSGCRSNYYRPVQTITFMIDYSFWGLNVVGYHLTSILLHISVALAAFWLINTLFNNTMVSLITSLLFLAHPIHTEAVCYISGRSDPQAALFMLLCLIFYIKSLRRNNPKLYVLALLSYLLALLSKENSVVLPAVILLVHYVLKRKPKIKECLPFFVILIAYVYFRLFIIKYPALRSVSFAILLERIPGFLVAITKYLKLLILPAGLHLEYEDKLFSFMDHRVILGLFIFLLLLVFAIFKRKNQLVFFSIGWFFMTLLPVTNIYPVAYPFMMEHWVYLPSLGFFLFAANIIRHLSGIKTIKNLTGICLTVTLITYSCLTIKQSNYWKDPVALYERALEFSPDNWRCYGELGMAYADRDNIKKALLAYKKALEINPGLAKVYYDLADAYCRIGDNREAIESYRKAIELAPRYIEAYVNLGNIYYFNNRKEEAIVLYKKALEINPDFVIAHANLALAYYSVKQYVLATEHLSRAMKLGYKFSPLFLELLAPHKK